MAHICPDSPPCPTCHVDRIELDNAKLRAEVKELLAGISRGVLVVEERDRLLLQIDQYETADVYDHQIMDEFAREFFPDEEGKTWAAGFSLGKLLEMVREGFTLKRKDQVDEGPGHKCDVCGVIKQDTFETCRDCYMTE